MEKMGGWPFFGCDFDILKNRPDMLDMLEKETIKSEISEEEENEDSKDDLKIGNINSKSTRFSKLFKKNKDAVDRTRQTLIKKTNEEDVAEKAGQILREVCVF